MVLNSPSPWLLALVYWLHLLATGLWVGGLAIVVLFVVPTSRKSLPPEAFSRLLGSIQRQLSAIGWFCLALLAATGLLQMSANPNYHGFLAITNRWAVAILLKHIVFLIILLVSAYLTWGLGPAVQRAVLLQSIRLEAGTQELERLHAQEMALMWMNLILAVVVLGLTALARVS